MNNRIALGVEYDGSNYHGWQIQPNQNTVQGQLQRALSRIADMPVQVICAGRTDVGVHAQGQVVHFDPLVTRDLDNWLRGTNGLLPSDIVIRWARAVPETFHARFSAVSRSYRYRVYNAPIRSALHARSMTWYRLPLNHLWMDEAAQSFIGTHDFSALRDSQCQAKTPIRTISQLEFSRDQDVITMHITANAFLHHMVRNIMGVLLPIGAGLKPVIWAQEVLNSRDRRKAGMTAPSQGLNLMHVEYPASLLTP